ncbi:Spy/CpxP family protein refolding chaperone [Pseudozobellia thermophila]|uniref:LTXXQ motif family protein n=1 Tax=Pseudozobellia thermophila TaxID=192903 RepID=A0A1M6NG87_9FLAO|nr:Spy/CpxP family protein refolding chaperone [Pseudozobellia thermophila]SHJ94603.1 hypothetical protein SAMN04488513_11345 [Pseudozobellia thermophila]
MKKVFVIVLCMVGLTAMAQKGERGNRGMKDLSPEQVATLQTKKMTLALDLTQEQQAKIQAINLEQAKERKAKMEERKAAREKGEAKKPTAEERYAMQNERLDKMIAHKAEMKKILSEEQYQKWQKMAHNRKKKDGDRRGKERHSRR